MGINVCDFGILSSFVMSQECLDSLNMVWSENIYWCKWIALLNAKECGSNFFDTLFHFLVIHYFVRWTDDVILLAKGKERIQDKHISKGKSTCSSPFKWNVLLNIVSIHETNFITSFSSAENVSPNCNPSKLRFSNISILGESKKKFRRLEGCGIKSMWPIFKT